MTGEEVSVLVIVEAEITTSLEQRLCSGELSGFGFGFGFGFGLELGLRLSFVEDMGCSGSKVDDLPLVIRCRERKDLIKAAADQRYALAAAQVAYFHSLKDVGDALRKFVDEELVLTASSSSTTTTAASSPAVALHSLDDDDDDDSGEEGSEKRKIEANLSGSKSKSKRKSKRKNLSSEDLGSGGASHLHHNHDDDDSESHLHLSSDDSDGSQSHVHHHHHDDIVNEDEDFNVQRDSGPGPYVYGYGMMNQPPPDAYWGSFPSYFGLNQPYEARGQPNFENPGMNFRYTNVYYMKKPSPVMKTVIHDAEPVINGYTNSYYSYPFEKEGSYGYPMGQPMQPERDLGRRKPPRAPRDPPPPPSPKASAWDFFNPFDVYDSGNPVDYSGGYGYGYGSNTSSPDSTEVRKREGIPDLEEEETENEVYKEVQTGKFVNEEVKRSYSGEGSSGSKVVPLHNNSSSGDSSNRVPLQKNSESGYGSAPMGRSSESSSKAVPLRNSKGNIRPMPSSEQYNEGSPTALHSEKSEASGSIDLTEDQSSSEIALSSKSPDDVPVSKKGVSFEVDETQKHEVDSSKFSSLTVLSPRGTRDLREVVAEIRDEFAVASDYGKEVAVMLEVGKLPYQPSFIRVVLSRLLYLISPSLSSSYPPSLKSVKLASKSMRLVKSYFGDVGKDIDAKPCNLSSTLEKLYAWEKKLFKEVKDEERLRVIYEKQCKRLQILDGQGAEASKIDPVRASIRKLLTKLKICIKTIDAISSRIHKLRDEELQPQVAELIHGLIRMWRAMLRCHQKQFQAIMESKIRTLRANTAVHEDSNLRATIELEMELRSWLGHFNNWISTQKSYVESLNGWLVRCLLYEPEQTPDGPVPFSPGRLGAPPIFVICNDWNQAMENISETLVANAMHNFALSLRELWEKQDEEQRQRLKGEDLRKDFKNQLKSVRVDKGRTNNEHDTMSDKTSASIIRSTSGVSPLDDLKVDLDLVRKRLAEERAKHKDAIKIVHDAASTSVQGGLVPIFKALESFSLEALKAHEQVRLQNDAEGL